MYSVCFTLFVRDMSDLGHSTEKIAQQTYFTVGKRPGSGNDQNLQCLSQQATFWYKNNKQI